MTHDTCAPTSGFTTAFACCGSTSTNKPRQVQRSTYSERHAFSSTSAEYEKVTHDTRQQK
eukprot:4956720-Amphidinium_carterae.1